MKMTPEHFAILSDAVSPLNTEANRDRYRNGNFHNADKCKDVNMRFRWDCLNASKLNIGDGTGTSGLPLYAYLDDSHIDTALRAIISPL